MLRGLGCRLGIDLFERGDIAPPRNFYAPLFQGAFGRKILPQPEPKPACVGTDDVVDLRVVTRRALKDCFSNGSFIDARVIPQQSLPTDVEEERGQAGGIEEATTGRYPLDEQPPGIVFEILSWRFRVQRNRVGVHEVAY